MEIISVHNETQWDAWLSRQGDASFLQSFAWGEILIAEGKQVERLAVVEDGETLLQAQVVYTQLPLGWQYAFCPKGPVGMKNEELRMKNQQTVYDCLLQYLKNNKCIFWRVEPSFVIRNSSFVIHKSVDLNPRATSVLDLGKSVEGLLAAMHAKTRYNIRLAEKKDLKIERVKDFGNFWKLMEKTGERDGFTLHSKKHYELILSSSLSHQVTIFQGGQPLAVGIFIGCGDTFTYLFGASDHAYRQLMAPYLVQWAGIELAKKLGYSQYDFFGIAPKHDTRDTQNDTKYEYDSNHQYAGVTRFKLGFGGAVIEAPGTYDLIISPLRYKMYQILRRLRRLL